MRKAASERERESVRAYVRIHKGANIVCVYACVYVSVLVRVMMKRDCVGRGTMMNANVYDDARECDARLSRNGWKKERKMMKTESCR